jgi:putative PIN family toxin of toxin-antitoxin system
MKRYYAVIDTNVIVSALMTKNQHSPTVKLLDFVVAKTVVPVYNDDILEEYKDVLSRAKFHFDTERIDAVLETIRTGIYVGRTHVEWDFPDEDDAVFYEVAMSVDDAYLVTGNTRHFPKVNKVVTPAEMVNIIEEANLIN